MTKSDNNFSTGHFFQSLTVSAATLVIILGTLLTSGCGDGRDARVPVKGTVTIDGEPLKFGSITFHPSKKGNTGKTRAGGGSLDSEGRFQISSYTPNDGLLKGNYDVTVLAIEPINDTSQRWHAPKEYSQVRNAKFSFELNGAMEDLKIELKWEVDPKHSEPFVEKF